MSEIHSSGPGALCVHICSPGELQAAYRHLEAAEAERNRAQLNLRRMALLAEAFIYEPHRITEGGLVAQILNALTDQDVEYNDDRAAPTEGTE